MLVWPGDDLGESQILSLSCEQRTGRRVPLSADLAFSSASVRVVERAQAGEQDTVWVSVSAKCGHMTRGMGLILNDSPLTAVWAKKRLLLVSPLLHPDGSVSRAVNPLVVFSALWIVSPPSSMLNTSVWIRDGPITQCPYQVIIVDAGR